MACRPADVAAAAAARAPPSSAATSWGPVAGVTAVCRCAALRDPARRRCRAGRCEAAAALSSSVSGRERLRVPLGLLADDADMPCAAQSAPGVQHGAATGRRRQDHDAGQPRLAVLAISSPGGAEAASTRGNWALPVVVRIRAEEPGGCLSYGRYTSRCHSMEVLFPLSLQAGCDPTHADLEQPPPESG